ncbi:MAG: glycosyltransferase family 2 protein [Alphaproteobacteria bacterium]
MLEHIYTGVLIFIAFYPIVTSIMWLVFSITYKIRWEEMHHEVFPKHNPEVSVIVPTFNEEHLIENALTAMCAMTYPHYEIIIVNDGSNDGTLEKIKPFLSNPKVRLLNKTVNQGKSLALNDAFAIMNGEIVVVLDADAQPAPDLLQHLTWHFQHARVGAVTGHPRVKNATNFLTRIQVIEFTSIIGLIRRSQRIWGRIMTVSGIVAAFRKEAILGIGGFRPDMYTEDIDATWRLERKHWDVRYEPRAIVWMHAPDTLRVFFKQRLRWARGLIQVLMENKSMLRKWEMRRLWTIFYESSISIVWNALYGIIILYEGVKYLSSIFYTDLSVQMLTSSVSVSSKGVFVFGLHWIVVMSSFSLMQLLIGGLMEYKHDNDIIRFFPYAIFYPSFYWVFMTVITLTALPTLWTKHRDKVDWSTKRDVRENDEG